ncbi:MAG: hypothetical protein JRC87_07415 [Deltaproteobacteria bacterium]|nr:hypothetical protein [Deltaproteobacteria bacterium]
MSDRCTEFIKALAISCHYLAKAEISNDSLKDVLKIFGQSMNVRGISLIKKRYINNNKYLFEFTAQWSGLVDNMSPLPDPLIPQNLPLSWIATLSEERPVIVKYSELSLLGANSNLLLIPVFVKDIFHSFWHFLIFKILVLTIPSWSGEWQSVVFLDFGQKKYKQKNILVKLWILFPIQF